MNSDSRFHCTTCPKCKKSIPDDNFLVHSTHCERNPIETKMDVLDDVADDSWVCPFCTLRNENRPSCEACSNPKPGTWICKNCFASNTTGSACSHCGSEEITRKSDQPVTETLLNDDVDDPNPSSWNEISNDDESNSFSPWFHGMMIGAAGMGIAAVSRNRPVLQDILLGGLIGATVGGLLTRSTSATRHAQQPRTESRPVPITSQSNTPIIPFVSWTTTTISSNGNRQTILTSSSSSSESRPYISSRVEDFDLESLPLHLFRRSLGMHRMNQQLETLLASRGIQHAGYEDMLQRLGMPVPVAGSRADIDNIETREFCQSDGQEMCVVCQDDIAIGRRIKKLKCSHMFHSECVDEWLQRNGSCPTCKRRINE